MNYAIILFIIGCVIRVEALFMLLPGLVSLIYHEKSGLLFFPLAAVFYALGYLMSRHKPENTRFYARDGYVVVALSW
ncbi:MAG: TrkH family potassium uptake protein, partial [Firmicutes bacterium]|nr:TrkH family potassium uptake protein [Bacillota bacterium]